MITLQKYGKSYNRNVLEIVGLSTDDKPDLTVEGVRIINGSIFTEIDTGKTYRYDEENMAWNEIANAGGGSGMDGKSAYEIAVDNGFDGDESDWLASLKGDKGDKGEKGEKGDAGLDGSQGERGASGAYPTGIELITTDGVITGGTVTMSDSSTFDVVITETEA